MNGWDNSEEPNEVDRTSETVGGQAELSDEANRAKSPGEVGKSSSGKVPVEANVSGGASRDEVSRLGEAGVSSERALRSPLNGGDHSEEPDEVDRTSEAVGGQAEESDEANRAKSPGEVEKSSSGKVPGEAKSSSDNVSEGACRGAEAERKESPQERSLVKDTSTRSSVINENDRRIYEVDEKPEDRPRRVIKTPRKYSENEDYYVVISEPEDPQQPPKHASPPAVPPTEGRRPVRPRLPTVRSLRSVVEAPRLLSKKPQPETRRRRVELTADRLAKVASDNPLKSTKELAEELTAQYPLTPEERRRCLHLQRGMRVAQRHLCGRIRRAFPMTNGSQEREEFLGWLQKTVREVEGRDSDELE